MNNKRIALCFLTSLLAFFLAICWPAAAASSTPQTVIQRIDLQGPAGSEEFGKHVTPLPNGNLVVIDPYYDDGLIADVGAVYLYRGATGELISVLKGSAAQDRIGANGATVLSNGNFVVVSPGWNSGTGAVTWIDAESGLSGVVSALNSLVGGGVDCHFGLEAIALTNGNYVVASPYYMAIKWRGGAVTWGDGDGGTIGVVSAANSLVGGKSEDYVGSIVKPLTNGNYVVGSSNWDNGSVTDAGAVTWGNGATGTSGVVSPANSLVGSTAYDQVGFGSIYALSNGNYVVRSNLWDRGAIVDAGAATWGDGTKGITGTISIANSLVGSTAQDQVADAIIPLKGNGNYLVRSIQWSNGAIANAGALTWANGATGITGVVTVTNSLVGSHEADVISEYFASLNNGNYVTCSQWWDHGAAADAGACTWGNGETGVTGVVTVANSLVGSQAGDQVGIATSELANGNYVVHSELWNNGGIPDAGAVTWVNGASGLVGEVSPANSLVGGKESDQVGGYGVFELTNGNYVVGSANWDNGSLIDAGAATWADGDGGTVGLVTAANSLVGGAGGHRISSGYITTLTNGNYVVKSPAWKSGSLVNAGAATWGDGDGGTVGVVSAANSLVGETAEDQVGNRGILALNSGHYLVSSPGWDNGVYSDLGAVTWGDGESGTSGLVSTANSLTGSRAGDRIGDFPIWPRVYALADGGFAVKSAYFDLADASDAGAVTLGSGSHSLPGAISGSNSILGSLAGKGENLTFWEDPANRQVIVGLPDETKIVLAHLAYPLVTTVSGNGTVTRSPAQDAYREGMTVTLTASGDHSAFTGWSGDLTGNQNPVVITMEAARTITAAFQALEFRNYVPFVKKP